MILMLKSEYWQKEMLEEVKVRMQKMSLLEHERDKLKRKSEDASIMRLSLNKGILGP